MSYWKQKQLFWTLFTVITIAVTYANADQVRDQLITQSIERYDIITTSNHSASQAANQLKPSDIKQIFMMQIQEMDQAIKTIDNLQVEASMLNPNSESSTGDRVSVMSALGEKLDFAVKIREIAWAKKDLSKSTVALAWIRGLQSEAKELLK